MKRQNYHRKKFIWKKTLFSAILTAVLFVNVWAAVLKTAQAVSEGAGNKGRLYWDADDQIWDGLTVDGLDGKLNLTVNQVTVGSKSYTLTVNKENAGAKSDKQTMILQEDYSPDDAFSLKDPIQDPVYDSGAVYKANDKEYSIDYVNFIRKGTVTYYKTITNGDSSENSKTTFDDFEEKVKVRYGENENSKYTVSTKMLMTTQDSYSVGYGKAFEASVKA